MITIRFDTNEQPAVERIIIIENIVTIKSINSITNTKKKHFFQMGMTMDDDDDNKRVR